MSAHEEDSAPSWRRGIVIAVSGYKAKVKFPDWDGMVSAALPVVQLAALGAKAWIIPRVGSQVAVLIDEHGEDGVILGGIYSGADPAPSCNADAFHLELEDGTAVTLTAGKIIATTPGDIEATAGGSLTATAGGSATIKASGITLDGPVTCTQTLTVVGPAALNAGMTVAAGDGGAGATISGGLRATGGATIDQATIDGRDFSTHTHTAQGATAVTTAPN
jgi:phage baseplate assembly protein V